MESTPGDFSPVSRNPVNAGQRLTRINSAIVASDLGTRMTATTTKMLLRHDPFQTPADTPIGRQILRHYIIVFRILVGGKPIQPGLEALWPTLRDDSATAWRFSLAWRDSNGLGAILRRRFIRSPSDVARCYGEYLPDYFYGRYPSGE